MLSTAPESLLRLPKAELHVHLDGSLRPATMLELAAERGVSLPHADAAALGDYMVVDDAANLEEYLERFGLTLSLMQDAEAIRRIAYELAEDYAAENTRYLEVRFCPALNTEGGLADNEVLDAALAGLKEAEQTHGIRTAVIVCALRSLPPSSSTRMAELATAYADRGVCAFDLAGAEAGYPVRDHLDAFDIAKRADLAITIHAGEGFGAQSIAQAVELGGARRIGHGTRLYEDPALMARVRDAGIALEVCLTSNVQTGVASDYDAHPVRRYFDDGIPVALCTDNRLMSGVTLTDEYRYAASEVGFSAAELVRVARAAFETAFAPAALRSELLADFDRSLPG